MNSNAMPGPGGAPTRATTIPDDAKGRKQTPIASGVLDYFPDALVALARISYAGNEQHNPGKSLRWDRAKSGDEADCVMRHFLQRGTVDTDGELHTAKAAWRMLALLQKEIEVKQGVLNESGHLGVPRPAGDIETLLKEAGELAKAPSAR